MGGTLLSFLLMAIGGRELSASLDTGEILLYRSIIGLLVVCALLAGSGFGGLRTRRPGVHVLRGLAHFGGQYGWFFGLASIPLAEVFALEFTLPVWSALFAALLLRERLTGPRLGAIGFGLLGMLVILRPGLAAIHPAAFAVLASAAGYALSHVLTRMLALSDPPLVIVFYMTLVQLPPALLSALPGGVALPAPEAWPWLGLVALTALGAHYQTGNRHRVHGCHGLVALTALGAHYCMARALALAEATVVVPIDFLRLPLIALLGFVLYAEPVSGAVMIGGALMLAGNYINVRAEGRGR